MGLFTDQVDLLEKHEAHSRRNEDSSWFMMLRTIRIFLSSQFRPTSL